MADTGTSTLNLGLSAVPEVNDPKLFPEFVRIYNALKLLSVGLDGYTAEGTITTQVQEAQDATDTAALYELRKQYYRYTVPKFTVKGAFACNGQVPSVAVAVTQIPTTAPASGAGTAAGAFDTAATRDAAIAAINANTAAILELQAMLKKFGLAS